MPSLPETWIKYTKTLKKWYGMSFYEIAKQDWGIYTPKNDKQRKEFISILAIFPDKTIL